ncbi:MAG: hypothetical protein AAF663_10540 [Planctomycetota bacterium]
MPSKTTKSRRPDAIRKLLPYDDFPLSPHVATGRGYKKIRGKRHYFGPLDDWRGPLDRYTEQRNDLELGRTPREV